MNKLLSLATAVLFLGILSISFAQDAGRGGTSATWQVQKYDLDVSLPSGTSRIVSVKALLNIRNVSGSPASTLTLRISPDAQVVSVRINDSPVEFSRSDETVTAGSRLQRIATRIPSVSANSSINALVDYRIDLKENSALGSVTPSASTFLPLSYWYPTPNSWFFRAGADVAPVRIKVGGAGGNRVVSSGVEADGVFDMSVSAQPFFITGTWETSIQNGVAVYMPAGAGAEGQKRAAELAVLVTEARAFFTTVLGKAPDVPLRVVSARRGAGFGSGGTMIVEEAVFRRSKVDSLTVMNIAEAAAKLWLGNAVTVNGDGHGAISEGLSRYLATQFIEHKFGKDVADIERMRQRNAYAAVSKRDAPIALVSPLDDYYFPVVANKGAMAWRLIASRVGSAEFANIIRDRMQDGNLNLAELRSAFSSQKDLIDYLFDQITDMNLLVGLPQKDAGETKAALRNTGAIDADVDVVATTLTGERLKISTTIKAASFGEAVFKTAAAVSKIEIDVEKLYPQIEYSDDIAPRTSTESDPLIAAKRPFDRQDFIGAETAARSLLRDHPHLDDLRVIYARALLAQNKNTEAEREFRIVLEEKLPTSRSLAWANVGLAEIASRGNQRETAQRFIEAAIAADSEYGATLAARNLRSKIGTAAPVDESVKAFFVDFDRAASSNRKANVDQLVMPGEVTRFAAGVSGSTESWRTQIRHVDRIDANTVLVEANMTVKLLNKTAETGLAVYRLVKLGNTWKLAAVEMFEVR